MMLQHGLRLRNPSQLAWVTSIVAGLFTIAVNTFYIYSVGPHPDFISFWSAGRWLAEGRDPYALYFMYPLWVALLLIPIGALPFLPAAVAWLTLNEALFAGAVILSIRLSRASLRLYEKALLALGMLLLAPTLFTFFNQQSSLIILFLLVVAVLAWQRGHLITAGVIMALALSKPHLTLLIVMFWLFSGICRGEWRLLNGFTGGLLALLTLAELFRPGWLWPWLAIWQGELTGWLAKSGPPALQNGSAVLILLFAGAAPAIAAALALLIPPPGRRPSHSFGLTLVIPVGLTIALRSGSYDLALLILPLILLIAPRRPAARLALLGGTVALTSCLTFLANHYHNRLIMQSMSLWVLLGAVILGRRRLRRYLARLAALLQRPMRAWPESQRRALLRFLIVVGIASIGFYFTWWRSTDHFNSLLLLGLLTCASLINLLQILCIWYLYLHIATPPSRLPPPGLSVDVFVTSYHEPLPLIERALRAALNIRYPHRTYLLDDGREPECRALANRLGAIYLTRSDNADAKAGNVNHALGQTDGEFITVFDVDHAPQPEFLDRVLGHFQDPQVGFVQVMLSHCNQGESFVAHAAAEQTYDAFGPTFMGVYGCGGASVIGSNTTFRREALEDIGGYKPGLAEDLHTSVHMHAKGWRSVYVPEVLAYGLVPGDLLAFFKQQLKWARGVFEVFLEKYPLLAHRLTLQQQICYFTRMTYYLAGPVVAVNQLFLVLYLLFGSAVVRADFARYLGHWLPFMITLFLIRQAAIACWRPDPASSGFHLRGVLLVYGTWPIYTLALICALLRIKIPFIATPKERQGGNYLGLILPQIIAVALLLFSAGWCIAHSADVSDWVVIAFALLNVALHSGIFYAVREGYLLHSQRVRRPIPLSTRPHP
jgi:cellulose synthase (UDP-forming)